MATLNDLLLQKEILERQIADARQQERVNAIATVKALMGEYGLVVEDLMSSARARRPAKSVVPKYRNQATGETWSGRGLRPKWLQRAIENGASIGDFAV